MDDDININFQEAKYTLCYIFLIFNIFIIFVSLYLLKSQKKFIKMLKNKLFTFIILDTTSFIFDVNFYKNIPFIFNQIFVDILLAFLS